MIERIEESELIINKDGSIFHLHLKPDEIANDIILVGDPGRVETIAGYFDHIELSKQNREFVSCTGTFNGKRITVISTGIGTDNIDIVVNELDALANVDFTTRTVKEKKRTLNLIRIGTSGALQADIPVDSWLISAKAIGFDGMLNFYKGAIDVTDPLFETEFMNYLDWNPRLSTPYVVNASRSLLSRIKTDAMEMGITISAPGFYGPQGRVIRLNLQDQHINQKIENFELNGQKVTNYEMECSAIYGLSALLGHEALTVCAIIANRLKGQYSKDYKPVIEKLIETVLVQLTK
ncbi:MAG: nucleoside phosphorylase [Breznakibacter sp.]